MATHANNPSTTCDRGPYLDQAFVAKGRARKVRRKAERDEVRGRVVRDWSFSSAIGPVGTAACEGRRRSNPRAALAIVAAMSLS